MEGSGLRNRNFNIWQNGVKVASNHPCNYVIRQVPINKTIEFQVSTWEYLHRAYYTQESPKTGKVAFEISDGLKNCQQIGSAKRYRCDSSAGSLKSTLKGGLLVLVPTDIGDQVLYAGLLDDGGLCTLHVPGGADESLTTGLVGWIGEVAANDSCSKDGKSCGGDGSDGGGGGGRKPGVDKPDFVCGKDQNGNERKCI